MPGFHNQDAMFQDYWLWDRLTSKIEGSHVPLTLKGANISLSYASIEEIFSNEGSRLIN